MKPIEVTGIDGRSITYGANQSEYEPLPAVVQSDGTIWTRWQLSPEERRAILDGAAIELSVMTFGQPIQPLYMRVQGIEEPVLS